MSGRLNADTVGLARQRHVAEKVKAFSLTSGLQFSNAVKQNQTLAQRLPHITVPSSTTSTDLAHECRLQQ